MYFCFRRRTRWYRRFLKSVPLGAPTRIQRSYDTESSEETEEKRPVTNDFVDTAVPQNSIDNYTRRTCKDFKVLLHVKSVSEKDRKTLLQRRKIVVS